MKSISLFSAFVLAKCVSALPVATCPPKVNGRLFEIDGETQYFAGNWLIEFWLEEMFTVEEQVQTPGGWDICCKMQTSTMPWPG